MSYVVDHKKLPKQLLFELFKDANDLPFTVDDLTFANVSASSKEGYGTKVEVRWSTNHDIIGKINVYYNRMDLATLFSLSGLTVIEIYLDPAERGIILNDKVFAEITRRYGVVFTADDFDLSQTETGYLLSAKETNLAYTGSQHIDVYWSLETKIQQPVLNGFDVKIPNFFIEIELTLKDLPVTTSSHAVLPHATQLVIPTVKDTLAVYAPNKNTLTIPNSATTLGIVGELRYVMELASTLTSHAILAQQYHLGLTTLDETTTKAILARKQILVPGISVAAVIYGIQPVDQFLVTLPKAIPGTAVVVNRGIITDSLIEQSSRAVVFHTGTLTTSGTETTTKAVATHTYAIGEIPSCVPVNANYLMMDPLVYDGYSEVPTFATGGPMTAIAYDGGMYDSPAIATRNPITTVLAYS